MVVASTDIDVLGGLQRISRLNGNCELELLNAPHEFDKVHENQAVLFFMALLERIRV